MKMNDYKKDDIESGGFDLIPNGTYCAKVATAEETESKNGRTMAKVSYDVFLDTGLPMGHDKKGSQKVQKVFDILLLEVFDGEDPNRFLWKTKQFYDALNLWEPDGTAPDVRTDEWVGAYVKLKITTKYNDYMDENQNQVQAISAISDNEAAELDTIYNPF